MNWQRLCSSVARATTVDLFGRVSVFQTTLTSFLHSFCVYLMCTCDDRCLGRRWEDCRTHSWPRREGSNLGKESSVETWTLYTAPPTTNSPYRWVHIPFLSLPGLYSILFHSLLCVPFQVERPRDKLLLGVLQQLQAMCDSRHSSSPSTSLPPLCVYRFKVRVW